MMTDSHKRLGDYIREVDVRNRNLEVKLSQGISNEKHFQQPKQVAENPYNDKVVRTGQFAFNRATTRNGDKISIAYREGEDCTVSASYCVFYVTNENVLLSKYLMMWFRRPEFDRYAIYHSHGSAHEYFTYENMCDVKLPIPSIEKQQKILNSINDKTQGRVKEIYSQMKDAAIADVLSQMDAEDASKIMLSLESRKISGVLSKMDPKKASELTLLLKNLDNNASN